MPPERIRDASVNPPPLQPPERRAVQGSLRTLRNWREGSAATAVVMAVLLPFAIAWHVTYLVTIVASLVGAVTLAVGCHVARERRLTALAIFPELARLPDLAGKRRRLVSTRNRCALADGLRRAAAPTQPPRRFDCCPILPDRVAAVRSELLELASALKQNTDPDPTSVALIHELLTNGCSPLYNTNIPFSELEATIDRVRSGL